VSSYEGSLVAFEYLWPRRPLKILFNTHYMAFGLEAGGMGWWCSDDTTVRALCRKPPGYRFEAVGRVTPGSRHVTGRRTCDQYGGQTTQYGDKFCVSSTHVCLECSTKVKVFGQFHG